jgi:predicted  nucleic acid-binding Zn-ribbon protein
VIRNKDSVQKAKVEELENLVKKLEFEKCTLEEMCSLKDEEALISQVKSDERLANLHYVTDELSKEKENLEMVVPNLNEEIGESRTRVSKSSIVDEV